jgi:hypothetical protein
MGKSTQDSGFFLFLTSLRYPLVVVLKALVKTTFVPGLIYIEVSFIVAIRTCNRMLFNESHFSQYAHAVIG